MGGRWADSSNNSERQNQHKGQAPDVHLDKMTADCTTGRLYEKAVEKIQNDKHIFCPHRNYTIDYTGYIEYAI